MLGISIPTMFAGRLCGVLRPRIPPQGFVPLNFRYSDSTEYACIARIAFVIA